jgi:hypothetical protein
MPGLDPAAKTWGFEDRKEFKDEIVGRAYAPRLVRGV